MSVESPVIDHVDGAARRIFLRSGVTEYHPVDDIYKEMRERRSNSDTELRNYHNFVAAGGNIDKGAGQFTPRYAVFLRGTMVVPADEDHTLVVTGEQITDDGQSGSSIIDRSYTSPGVSVHVDYAPPDSELIIVNTAAEIHADQMMQIDDIQAKVGDLLKALINRQETNPATGVMTIFDDDSVTPWRAGSIYHDTAGTEPYDGSKGVNRRNRLE